MSDISRDLARLGGNPILHRSLDIQGHSELVQSDSGSSINETYQDEAGRHAWSLKRFPGVPTPEVPTDNDNNPKEVEK
ncbi:hypothetical protein ACFRJ9_15125 [Paenarthrobacter sp. NPDC056912]|uniref:hypothetical protein n=1 Tax=Paenarthrobacter sp. NPDC056912 TaxID=3345965 RepID=UPI00366B7F72